MDLYRSNPRKKKPGDFRRGEGASRSFRNSKSGDAARKSESVTVTCADCGTNCEVPFVPRTGRPVYCSSCFRQKRPGNSNTGRHLQRDRDSRPQSREFHRNNSDPKRPGNSNTGRYLQRDRDSRPQSREFHRNNSDPKRSGNSNTGRYLQRDRDSRPQSREFHRNNSDPKSSKQVKFLRKQESFYSNGSDKFYDSLKEKLFEILGGKVCSGCGFKDVRALGFSHKYDDVAFDNIQRGGAASSWRKYISDPGLARNDLMVLCLNCNQIRQPVAGSKNPPATGPKTRSGPTRKKYRHVSGRRN